MAQTSDGKKRLWGVLGALVTLAGLGASAVAIIGFIEQDPFNNINGTWIIETVTDTTSLSRYRGMKIKYEVQFIQNGDSFSGTGEKIEEQDSDTLSHALEGKGRTPINLTGSVSRSAIDAEYQEKGSERDTSGSFHWKLKNGSGAGTFSSTAAESKGSSSLHRQ